MKLSNLDRKIIHDAQIEKRRLRMLLKELSVVSLAKNLGVSMSCVSNFNSRKKSRRFLNTIEGKL